MSEDFKAGDVIVIQRKSGSEKRYTVQDPVRTRGGKLRVMGDRAATVSTAWWRPGSVGRYDETYWVER